MLLPSYKPIPNCIKLFVNQTSVIPRPAEVVTTPHYINLNRQIDAILLTNDLLYTLTIMKFFVLFSTIQPQFEIQHCTFVYMV